MHDLILKRWVQSEKATAGHLIYQGRFLCHTLEDPFRTEKLYGQTRIPAGDYKLKIREYGGFHKRYGERFEGMHRGMVQIMDVPNFTDILIHIGNTHEDTHGCILLGTDSVRGADNDFRVTNSTAAYKKVYPFLQSALDLKIIDGITILDEGEDWPQE